LLALALKEKYIFENINEHLDKIDTQDTRKEFLTIEEVQALYNTPCREPEVNPKSWTKIFWVYYAKDKKEELFHSRKVATDPAV
jgi:hypothetical protein